MTPEESKLALARAAFDSSGARELTRAVTVDTVTALGLTTDDVYTDFEAVLDRHAELVAVQYAVVMTVDELRNLVEYNRSEFGTKIRGLQPAFLKIGKDAMRQALKDVDGIVA